MQYCSVKFARAQQSHIRSDRIGSEEEMLFGTHVDTFHSSWWRSLKNSVQRRQPNLWSAYHTWLLGVRVKSQAPTSTQVSGSKQLIEVECFMLVTTAPSCCSRQLRWKQKNASLNIWKAWLQHQGVTRYKHHRRQWCVVLVRDDSGHRLRRQCY